MFYTCKPPVSFLTFDWQNHQKDETIPSIVKLRYKTAKKKKKIKAKLVRVAKIKRLLVQFFQKIKVRGFFL